jgi:hypothetical protein
MRRRPFFLLAIKASFARAYDLAVHAHLDSKQSPAFFLVPSLRGICEDLIALGFIQTMSGADRNELIANLMLIEVDEAIETQAAFYRRVRPDQPVLSPNAQLDPRIAAAAEAARAIWKRYGFNLTKSTIPQLRQLADRQGQHVLAILYDYFYSLSSGMVHFRPGVLLRLGWGSQTDFTFGVRQFQAYDRALIETYSLYLLCLYFEMFSRIVRPPQDVRAALANLREHLLRQERWPEMVTFEEMNLTPPRLSIGRVLARTAEAIAMKHRKFLR